MSKVETMAALRAAWLNNGIRSWRAINPKDIGYVDNPQEVRAFWINRIRWTDLG
jgi:hypothetical protein